MVARLAKPVIARTAHDGFIVRIRVVFGDQLQTSHSVGFTRAESAARPVH